MGVGSVHNAGTRNVQTTSTISSDTEEDGIDESAIDDDDCSDWEDQSVDDPGDDREETCFQRVDLPPTLVSHRSLITIMLDQNDRTVANAASKSPISPLLAMSPDSDSAEPLMMKKRAKQSINPIAEVPRSAAQPIIITTTNTTPHQLALSPQTTRRNMLATELTVSLRQHLLWERQQNKREHTIHDVANLKQYPDKVYMPKGDCEAANTGIYQHDCYNVW